MSRQLQSIGNRDVLIRGQNCEDDGSRIRDVVESHVAGQLFDVLSLITTLDWDPRDAGQVDQREVRRIGGIDREDDWVVHDALVGTGHEVGLPLDLLADLIEVRVLPVAGLVEHCPCFVALVLLGFEVHKAQLQGPSRHYTTTSRKKVTSYDGLDEGALATTLSAYGHDAWQADELLQADVTQLIDDCDELPEILVKPCHVGHLPGGNPKFRRQGRPQQTC
mmetsp:Transcript_157508/g.505150  ORF Transcript_157508/g.505150 Transcript_157508/m.505150 type:complete len:221 (+) Transcript_157508:1962-2624(+)